MHDLITLALYVASLVGMLYSSTAPQTQPYVFAAGTGHQSLTCMDCHHVHAPAGVQPQWMPVPPQLPRFGFYERPVDLLNDSSMLCLSCHDGAIAPAVPMPQHAMIVSQVGQSIGVTGDGFRFPMGNHPIGVRYNPANPQLTRQPGLRAGIEISLPGGTVQCVSCHDPHGRAGHKNLLVITNQRSQLCLSCHRI